MLNTVLAVILTAIVLIGVLHYNMRKMQIELPKQEITIKMNKDMERRMQALNCSKDERLCLNKYKQWLKQNSHRLQERIHVDNYRNLFGEAPFISVKELVKYSSAFPEPTNAKGSPLIQNTSLPPPQRL